MKTIKQLREYFECNEGQALRLQALFQVGLNHGRMGMFPNGDFTSCPDWINGIGWDIQTLENALDIEGNEVFDIYSDGHAEGLTQQNETEGGCNGQDDSY